MELEQKSNSQYLYKVLSFEHWQASQNKENLSLPSEDDAFIHFSKADQLDRLITKYWSESLQFVVLKINTADLKGNLVFESNLGGTAKYYHLYEGFIPFSSIIESRIVRR